MSVIYRNATVTVAGTSTDVAAHREKRLGMSLVNTSSDTISLAFNGAAVAGAGVVLAPGNGYVIEEDDKLNVSINAISSGTSSTLAVFEHYLDAL